MTHKTRGIVLRSIKYGETSLVVTIITELFGIQVYMVNGARSVKKGSSKAAMFQPGAILDMEVYYNELKAMHRIKESSWAVIYQSVLSDVIRNSIALYMTELIYKALKEPEPNAELFNFCEDAFISLDKSSASVAANIPLYFSLHLSNFFGFMISNSGTMNLSKDNFYLDLIEGNFSSVQPTHPHYMYGENAMITSELIKVMVPSELDEIKLTSLKRRELLTKYHDYYALHIQDFGQMKSLQILHEVLS